MQREKLDRIARMLGISFVEAKFRAQRTEQTFKSLGRVREHTGGRTIVYANERVPLVFMNDKHVVKLRALVKDPVDCPIAKCAKDPDACWLGAYSTSVHVGNATVTFWSELCPHLVVKSLLPVPLRVAIKDWDDQVKRKVKNRKFRLPDGTYFLGPYPPSLEHDKARKRGERKSVRGANINKPTRRLTVRSDISLAVAVSSATKHVQKRAVEKRKRKRS